MTTTAIESPDLNMPRGHYGDARVSHVKRLLDRATVASGSQINAVTIEKMRRHHQVSSCLLVQSLPLVRAEWAIECEDDRAREALTAAYASIAFDVHRSMARALWAGYSPNTLTWNYRGDLGGIYPVEVRDLAPDTCEPLVDDLGTLDGFRQRIAASEPEDFDPIYTLWITEGMESRNYYGRSLLTAALDPWADAAAIRAFHARYLERFGEPVVLCRAPAGKSIANQEAIEAAVNTGQTPPAPILVDNMATALDVGQNLRHHSVVALPSSLLFGADGKPTGYAWQLEYLEAKGGGGSDFLEALRECDRRIARGMFVPDLLSQQDGNTGSYALGQTHKSVWTETVEGRLDDYSRQITAQLLTPARLLNFGAGSADARLVFRPLTNEELDREWALVVELVKGNRLPVDGRELAEKYGLPLADDDVEGSAGGGAELEGEDRPAPPHPHHGHALETADRPGTVLASTDPTAGLPVWKVPQAYDPPPFRRPLNSREARVGFNAIEDGLNAAERRTIDQLVALLDVEHDRVLRQLNAIIRKGTPAEVVAALGTIEVKGGPGIVKAWADLMADVGGLALDRLRTELADYADQLPDNVTPEGRALFRAYATTNADRVLAQLVSETRLELLNAYTSGVSRAGMAAVVGSVFDAYTSGEGKGPRLTTRMLSAKALNHTRAAAVERGGIPLAGAQYSAILDRRTCDLCVKLDETVIAIENTDLARFTPPIHHNCRCVWVWITRDEEDFTPTWTSPPRSDVDRYGSLVL